MFGLVGMMMVMMNAVTAHFSYFFNPGFSTGIATVTNHIETSTCKNKNTGKQNAGYNM